MAQLTVRRLSRQIVDRLKRRAATNGRSAEAEHREILSRALLPAEGTFAERAREMRQRFTSGIDSTDTIRTDRYRNSE